MWPSDSGVARKNQIPICLITVQNSGLLGSDSASRVRLLFWNDFCRDWLVFVWEVYHFIESKYTESTFPNLDVPA